MTASDVIGERVTYIHAWSETQFTSPIFLELMWDDHVTEVGRCSFPDCMCVYTGIPGYIEHRVKFQDFQDVWM